MFLQILQIHLLWPHHPVDELPLFSTETAHRGPVPTGHRR